MSLLGFRLIAVCLVPRQNALALICANSIENFQSKILFILISTKTIAFSDTFLDVTLKIDVAFLNTY